MAKKKIQPSIKKPNEQWVTNATTKAYTNSARRAADKYKKSREGKTFRMVRVDHKTWIEVEIIGTKIN